MRALQERENAELLAQMAEALESQWGRTLGPYMRVALLCGGPGLRREATMDHARTIVTHLDTLARFGDGAAVSPLSPDGIHACHAALSCSSIHQ